MGLLAVDVTNLGVVMSADSQSVEILDGLNRVIPKSGFPTRNPIVMRTGGGFGGLVGFAGTEEIEGIETAEWLRQFSNDWPTDDVETFCYRLRDTLTGVWQRDKLLSVLEILLTGEVSGDLQFWFVRNSQGLRDTDWKHNAPAPSFTAKNDLDDPHEGYIQKDRLPGETKDDVLRRISYSFRQGVLVPGARVFDGFGGILSAMLSGEVEGFVDVVSLDTIGQFARMRMESLKRICTAKYGVWNKDKPTPIAGQVHVLGIDRQGRRFDSSKNVVTTTREGRSSGRARTSG